MEKQISKELPHYLTPSDFQNVMKQHIKTAQETGAQVALVSLDFDNFNYVNDLFGYEVGDHVLERLEQHFSEQVHQSECFTRDRADHFLFCLESSTEAELMQRFYEMTQFDTAFTGVLPAHYRLIASGGLIAVTGSEPLLSALLDKANYARKKAKGNDRSTCLIYDEKMGDHVQWQKIVTYLMESALRNREFELYLQPRVLIKDGQIVGAEALVRWSNPIYGMIYPDRFIPIMEQNGFIRQLDFFMLGEACRFLKNCIETGIPLLPVSVNFSRFHLMTENLVERIFQTVRDWGISPHLIEIEFTESLSVESFERLIRAVVDLKTLGFVVSLDDFGNAYSSLSCLKDMPFDVIKIDKGFLEDTTDTEKGKVVIAKMVELVKSMRMLAVVEGVETEEQLEYLRKLSCDMAQGYLFARPMPIAEYVKRLKESEVVENLGEYISDPSNQTTKSYLSVIPEEFQMDNWELYTLGKNIDMGLMKGYLDNDATVQYVNDRALEYLGYSRQEFRELFKNSIVAFTHPDDVHVVQANVVKLVETGKPLEFQTRAIRKDGKVIVLQGRSSCVMDGHGRPIGIYAFQDVTEELERTEALQRNLREKMERLRASEERYRIIVDQSEDIVFEWDFMSGDIHFSRAYEELFGESALEEHVTNNAAIRKLVYPDDIEVFDRWVNELYEKPRRAEAQFRIRAFNGKYIWMSCRATSLSVGNNPPFKAIGVYSNVTAQKDEMDALLHKMQRDPLTNLFNREETYRRIREAMRLHPAQTAALFIVDIDDFKQFNDSLGHQAGDNILAEIAQKMRTVFRETDIIGRIGGDEIAVFMQDCEENVVRQRASVLAQALHITYHGAKEQYRVTGSVGVALYPKQGRSFEELYQLADIALFESKNNGKDCVTQYHKDLTGDIQDNRTPVDWADSFLNTHFQHDFPFKVFETLYETKDIHASIQMILEILGNQYALDRVYIFQNDENELTISNTYEWCAPGIKPEMDLLQSISMEELSIYYSRYSEEGVFCCSDIREAGEAVYELCEPQGIKSLLHCALLNQRDMIGFVGFDDCTEYRNWSGEEIAMLGYLSRILSVFLNKTSTEKQLERSYRHYVEMLDNLNGFVYVIDPQTYQTLYLNKATQALGVSVGVTCHQMAFGSDQPCERCPMKKFTDAEGYATEEIYSEMLNGWVHAAASRFKWEGGQDVVLICCTDISQYKTS